MAKLISTKHHSSNNHGKGIMVETEDRISDLPDEVVCHILSFLPLRTAVKTSVLSSRWSQLCSSLPNLEFDKEFASKRHPREFIKIVNGFFEPSSRTKLNRLWLYVLPGKEFSSQMEKWLKIAKARQVEELFFDFSEVANWCRSHRRREFTLPDCFSHCESIKIFKLNCYKFSCPLNFNGFESLKSLYLSRSKFFDEQVQSLLSNCPHLESLCLSRCLKIERLKICSANLQFKRLSITHCSRMKTIEIDAPNLISFQLIGFFPKFYLRNISSLVDVTLSFENCKIPGNGKKLLYNLSRIKILTISSWVAEARKDHIKKKNKYLQLRICKKKDEIPSLDKDCCEVLMNGSDYMFDHLRIVEIERFTGSQNEKKLVEIFLTRSLVLERLVLKCSTSGIKEDESSGFELPLESKGKTEAKKRSRLFERLSLLRRASPNAKIVVC